MIRGRAQESGLYLLYFKINGKLFSNFPVKVCVLIKSNALVGRHFMVDYSIKKEMLPNLKVFD